MLGEGHPPPSPPLAHVCSLPPFLLSYKFEKSLLLFFLRYLLERGADPTIKCELMFVKKKPFYDVTPAHVSGKLNCTLPEKIFKQISR